MDFYMYIVRARSNWILLHPGGQGLKHIDVNITDRYLLAEDDVEQLLLLQGNSISLITIDTLERYVTVRNLTFDPNKSPSDVETAEYGRVFALYKNTGK